METYMLKDIIHELKKQYGDDAKVEIFEPVVMIGGEIEDLPSFKNNIAIVLHKNKKSYNVSCPLQYGPKDRLSFARDNGAIIIPVPVKEVRTVLSDNSVAREYPLCTKLITPYRYPRLKINTVSHLEIKEKYLKKVAKNNIPLNNILSGIKERQILDAKTK